MRNPLIPFGFEVIQKWGSVGRAHSHCNLLQCRVELIIIAYKWSSLQYSARPFCLHSVELRVLWASGFSGLEDVVKHFFGNHVHD